MIKRSRPAVAPLTFLLSLVIFGDIVRRFHDGDHQWGFLVLWSLMLLVSAWMLACAVQRRRAGRTGRS
ncbi:hypothetical protein [Streptomyces sp. NBC_00102]|uniref:hypothetical protein n=1 Tax=Streptomyces sp. NBC_00102 TaxID=2975652 RepID=UPI002259A27F|nr:hypothetical protein [Streptomyces sp. NBC_00102]MCX5397234.1 hypothetical protein [Streptomyces sp. NBC_00102]